MRRIDSFFPGNLIPLSQRTSLPCGLSSAAPSAILRSRSAIFSTPIKWSGSAKITDRLRQNYWSGSTKTVIGINEHYWSGWTKFPTCVKLQNKLRFLRRSGSINRST